MNIDQLERKLEWLDDERRRDKATIASLQERLTAYDGMFSAAQQEIKDLGSEVARLKSLTSRLDQVDESILQTRLDARQRVEILEKQLRKALEDNEKLRRVEMRNLENDLEALRQTLKSIPDLQKTLDARAAETLNLQREMGELRQRVEDLRHSVEDFGRTYRLIDEGRRQDTKRLLDVQGEVNALRKRFDEYRSQVDLLQNQFRKVENRMTELDAAEQERRQAQDAFIERLSMWQVERDRAWKEWQERFEAIERNAETVQAQLRLVDGMNQTVKRSQQDLEALAERVERRIGEISEMQRLSEERFRQEWTTFKADDQKRWTNYTISQDEQRAEVLRQTERLRSQLQELDDQVKAHQEAIQQDTNLTSQRLQALLALAHDWVATFERESEDIS
ncbi:MAG TPA: hypothetical protein ENJ02_04385 [Chloroflexi bacterium]|nr:hypothetical protein [Chloroflexota bacterium]